MQGMAPGHGMVLVAQVTILVTYRARLVRHTTLTLVLGKAFVWQTIMVLPGTRFVKQRTKLVSPKSLVTQFTMPAPFVKHCTMLVPTMELVTQKTMFVAGILLVIQITWLLTAIPFVRQTTMLVET